MIIKSAAIKVDDMIYTGNKHDEIIIDIIKNKKIINYIELNFGFITDNGLFVNRELAAEIAYAAGQTKTKKNSLISEDIE